MKLLLLSSLLIATTPLLAESAKSERAKNTIILNKFSAKNLGITFAETIETDFEQTLFAIGQIAEIPTNHSVVSSRIAGRVVDLSVIAGDRVKKGDKIVKVESRQAGDPPPTITLKAPSSGIVAESHIRLGEPVQPSSELLDILDLSKVWAIAKVPQTQAGVLKPGSKARIRVAALQNEIFDGELIRFGTTADASSGTLEAIFLLDNADYRLRPGMRSEFSIITSSRSDILAIPREALQGNPTNRFVFVKDFDLDHTFVKSPVQIGEENDLYVEIVAGLFPGDEVVTTGSYALSFAGKNDGPTLKEKLDADHGHEHNEDGSEMTAEQKKAKAKGDNHDHGEHGSHVSLYFFIGSTAVFAILFLITLQALIKQKRQQA